MCTLRCKLQKGHCYQQLSAVMRYCKCNRHRLSLHANAENRRVYLEHRLQLWSVLHDDIVVRDGASLRPLCRCLLAQNVVRCLRLQLCISQDSLNTVEPTLEHGCTLYSILHELRDIQHLHHTSPCVSGELCCPTSCLREHDPLGREHPRAP